MNRREFAEKIRDMVQDRITSLQAELDALNEALASPQEAQAPSPKLGWAPLDQLRFGIHDPADPARGGAIKGVSPGRAASHVAVHGAHRAFVQVATNDNGHSFTLVTRGPAE